MKKILVILESRASYGYSKNLINFLKNEKKIKVKTLVTGTHLCKELGLSINNIIKDKIKIDYKLSFDKENFSNGIGKLISSFSKILKIFKPNIVIIFGDRVELMGIAISCCYSNNIALAHVQAGDRSGHIDDMTRMSLAKLSHIHFPATQKAQERLISLGEDKKRIFLVGAPQLDDIELDKILKKKNILIHKKKVNLSEEYVILLQHPVFKDQKNSDEIYKKTINALKKINYKTYIIYPNYDPGYKKIIDIIKKQRIKNIEIFKNLNRQDFLALAAHSSALVGNSSSGILESPSLKIPVVNIGDRQQFREQNKNILNAEYNEKDIYLKIKKAINMKKKIKNIKNLHGDGKSSKRIFRILKKIKINKFILNKNTTY